MAREWLFSKILVLIGLVVGATVLSAASARAFYWYEWPGSSVPTHLHTNPSTKVTTKSTTPGGGGPPGGGPSETPEPTTLLAAGIGLGVMGVVRAVKAKRPTRRPRSGASEGDSTDVI